MTQPEPSPRVVVDSNLFVSASIIKRGQPYALLAAWRRGAFQLLISKDQLGELTDVFGRPRIVERYHLSRSELAELFTGLAAALRPEPVSSLPVIVRDPKDEHILAAALGGGADYLVTGDHDLLALRTEPRLAPLQIVTATEMLAILEEREAPDGC